MNVVLRQPETEEDFISLAKLARELAEYHQDNFCPNPDKLKNDAEWYSSRLISVENMDIGFVAWHKLYACQSAERGIELQNLYVDQKYRGKRLGIRLVLEVIREAIKLNCAEIKIGLRKENAAALEFYRKLGCTVFDRNDIWRCKIKQAQWHEIIARAEAERSGFIHDDR